MSATVSARMDKKVKATAKLVHQKYMIYFTENKVKLTKEEKDTAILTCQDTIRDNLTIKQRAAYHQYVSDNFAEVSEEIESTELGEVNRAINEKWHAMTEKKRAAYKKECGIEEKVKRKPTLYNMFISDNYESVAAEEEFQDLKGKEKNTAVFRECATRLKD